MRGRGLSFEYWEMENRISFTGGPSKDERSMTGQQDAVWIKKRQI